MLNSFLTVALSLALSSKIAQGKNCDNIPTGLAKMTLGVDITHVDFTPIESEHPVGFRGGVIKFTCDEGKKWVNPYNKEVYQVPDQIWSLVSIPTSIVDYETKIYRSASDVKDKRSKNFRVKAGGKYNFLEGSLSFSYSDKSLAEDIEKNEQTIAETTSHVSSIGAVLSPSAMSGLSDEVKEIIEKLPENFTTDPTPYNDFIDTFGTHYIQVAKQMGGSISMMFYTSENYSSHLTDDELKIEAEAQFSCWLLASVSVGGGYQKSNVESNSEFSKNSYRKIRYYGGHTSLLKNERQFYDWEDSVSSNPWLYSADFVPLYTLIDDTDRRESMKLAYETYLSKAKLNQLSEQIAAAYHKYRLAYHTAILKSLAEKVVELKANKNPKPSDVEELNDDVQFHLIKPKWWKEIQLCFYTSTLTSHYATPLHSSPTVCAPINQYTPLYNDKTVAGKKDTTRIMNWGIFAPYQAKSLSNQLHMSVDTNEKTSHFNFNGFMGNYTDDDTDSTGSLRLSLSSVNDDYFLIPHWIHNIEFCVRLSGTQINHCNKGRGSGRRTTCGRFKEWASPLNLYSTSKQKGCGYEWGLFEIFNSTHHGDF